MKVKSRTESDYEQKLGIQNTVNGMGKIHNRFAIQKMMILDNI